MSPEIRDQLVDMVFPHSDFMLAFSNHETVWQSGQDRNLRRGEFPRTVQKQWSTMRRSRAMCTGLISAVTGQLDPSTDLSGRRVYL